MDNSIEIIKLFNEKADKLSRLSFTNTILNTKSSFSLTFMEGEQLSAERIGPSQEAIDAFVLTLRFFIQNNEPISLKNMDDLYSNLPIDSNLKTIIRSTRSELREYLDGISPVMLNGERLIRREIFDVFLWGGLAHSDKKDEFESWHNFNALYTMLEDQFVQILIEVLNTIFYIRDLNNIAIGQLEYNI
ncbi:MAG TPA: hypothetical protein VEG39_01470 [Clostridia bacterium]|nr:hypothetical protein [Clostridia bacterium]